MVVARKWFAIVFLALTSLLAGSSTALAAGGGNTSHDPAEIGGAIKGILAPNAKDLWWCGLVVGVLGLAIARKGSRGVGIIFMCIGAGIVIFNAGGAQDMMTNLANRLI